MRRGLAMFRRRLRRRARVCDLLPVDSADLEPDTKLDAKEGAMELHMTGKAALVTGASAGIGKAIAAALAREGVDVAICARRREPLDAAAAEIGRETNRKIVPITADLTKPEDAANFVGQAHAALGRIDILVNNAGSAPGGIIEVLSEDDWAQSLQLKFMGYVRCLKHVLPIMQRQKKGRVINLIGNDGVKPSYWEIAPGAANAAGQNLTLALAAQYGKDSISFVAVNPGPVRTERWAGLVDAMARDMKIAREEADTLAPRSIPLGRIAESEEVASLVCYLASDLAHFINGTMIEIDGGQQKPLMDRFRDR
jgi:NAD(P)-dependent dehydrogenase (short-subunit alcohol dehydrogenase family)